MKCVCVVLNKLNSLIQHQQFTSSSPTSVKTAIVNFGVFAFLPGGKPEALPHTIPRRAEEHGEDSPVGGSQAEGG